MELQVGGKTYRTRPLTPRQAFHVSRRMAPVVVARIEGLSAMARSMGLGISTVPPKKDDQAAPETAPPVPKADPSDNEIMITAMLPVARALAEMSDANADFVLTTCLAVVDLQIEGGNWAPVQAPGGTRLMFDTLRMDEMMQLVQAVVKENCGDFFPDPSGNMT